MTTFGKVLIFLNLVLSIAGAAWAMALYTQRVNWTAKAGADGTQGKIKELTDKINQGQAALALSEARFDSAPAQLFYAENLRAIAQDTYSKQLAQLNAGEQPAQEVVVKDGIVVVDPKAPYLPLFQQAKDRQGALMPSIGNQLSGIHKIQDNIRQVMVDIDKAHADNAQITALLIGDKGLRERVAQEHAKTTKIEESLARRDLDKGTKDGELRTRTRDYEVERDLLAERNKQLEERIKELEKTGVARQP
jgi:hypothetical protein